MEETGILAFLFLLLIAGGLAAWHLLRGAAGSPRRRAARALVLAAVAGPLVAFGAYRLTNSRTFQVVGSIVARVETSSPVVALTFDDGPNPAHAAEILSTLQRLEIPATFFLVGKEIEANPDLCRRLVEQGHELGNHTYSHQPMVFVPLSFVESEIDRTDEQIRGCGYAGPIQFRPPNSKKLFVLPYFLAHSGRNDILTDVEPDSLGQIASDPGRMVQYVLDRARPGSIILLHPWYATSANALNALPGIVDGLRARGLRFVTVSQLLAMQGR